MGIKERARAIMKEHGVPILPGSEGVLVERRRSDRDGGADRLSGDSESLGGRRRARHARGERGRGTAGTADAGAAGSGRGVFERRRLSGKIHRRAAAYRVPDSGRRARQCGDSGRARMQHPAPASEAAGGIALAGAARRSARAGFGQAEGSHQGHRLQQCGHGRVPDG